MKLSRDLWLQVEPLLTIALDMDEPARAAWLVGIETAQPEAAKVLRRMLEAHERAARSRELETVPRLAPSPGWSSAHAAGARVGPFELVRPLGHGGMGEVWLARQADGRVERVVALKLPALSQQGEIWRERFRRERDILAKLEHPHIARLYDAGVTEAGQPWLAMEFVEGMSLSEHVASRSLSIAQCLVLFRQVLAAVAHAHRNLVVHRDLKPANILIDASGQVKLLDFGIAKLVDEADAADAAADLTRMGGRVMTLRYAAPEQVAAGTITTATDIYALGVILHELLTGVSPYRAVREGKALTDVMLLREETLVPSTLAAGPLARQLAGDLDAIVLKAMRGDPAYRYASVEQFDEDIRAHLEKRPVKARAGTWRYLAGRFAVRHKLPFATAVAVLVTLLAGLMMVERERRVAVAEKARAERHFASVRKLANTFIFDVHREIETLPGSLKAREMLVATSLEYLDALAREPGSDPALLFEVASAYRSIGSIQGQPRAANRGNLSAGIANFEKSADLLARLEGLKPGDIVLMREHWLTSYVLATAYFQVLDPRWRAAYRRTIGLAERIAAAPGGSVDDQSLAAFSRAREAHVINISTGRTAATMATLAEAIELFERLRPRAPRDAALHERLASLYSNAGVGLAGPGDSPPRIPDAIVFLEKSVALARELLAEAPDDVQRQGQMRVFVMILARRLAAQGELKRASVLMEETVMLVEKGVARDPDDVTMAVNRLEILVGAADVANRMLERERAMRICREVLASAAKLPKETAPLRDVLNQVAEAKVILGYALVATAEAEANDRERRLAMLVEARSLFADVSRSLDEGKLGAVPEYKLREFAQARERLDQAFSRLAAR